MTSAGTVRKSQDLIVRRALAIAGGVLLVALGAQAAIPVPGTPVPLTLQGPTVLIAGALLGPGSAAISMVLYLLLGAAGLPVFAPTGVPGLARLFGPTGGYLLAFPVAAALVGHIARDGRSWPRLAGGLLVGLFAIYAGGIAQLAALGGDLSTAWRLGSAPFLAIDLLKLLIAAIVVRRAGPSIRALL
jgi:biotin transport system substrate-specific component